MCIRCSGVHRSMGTHISKGTVSLQHLVIAMPNLSYNYLTCKGIQLEVRSTKPIHYSLSSCVFFFAVKSIDLDSWTAEQVENMIKWGNEKTNKYWEARLPAGSIPNEK